MRLLHGLAEACATFDDPNLESRAGLVPVMALAQWAGLADPAAEHVRIGDLLGREPRTGSYACGKGRHGRIRRRADSACRGYGNGV